MDARRSHEQAPVLLICSPYLALAEGPSIWETASRAGVSAVELQVNPDLSCPDLENREGGRSSLSSERDAVSLAKQAGNHGISIEVLAAPILLEPGMTGAPPWTEKLLAHAGAAGAGQVSFPLVTENFLVPGISDEEYLDSALRIFASLVETARRERVNILFENLSVYLNRPEILSPILSGFSQDDLGFCLDPVNLAWYGHPIQEVYRICYEFATRITGLHIKNIKYPPEKIQVRRDPGWRYDDLVVPAEKGDLDFARLISEFRKSGFTGYYGLEDDSLKLISPAGRLAALRKSVEFVRTRLSLR